MYPNNALVTENCQVKNIIINCFTMLYIQYCAKVTQTTFDEFLGFSWLFKEISLQSKVPRLFRELSRYLLLYFS